MEQGFTTPSDESDRLNPVAIAAPAEVAGSDVEGSLSFDVTFGYSGNYTAAPHGLERGDDDRRECSRRPGRLVRTGRPGHDAPLHKRPCGQAHARFSLFDDYTDGNDDLDLYVYYPNGSFAGGSGSGTSANRWTSQTPR